MDALLGLLPLLVAALAGLFVLLVAILVFEARRPPRHTAAYAVARGLPCDPGDVGLAFEAWSLDRPDGAGLPVWEIAVGSQRSAISPESPQPTADRRRPDLTALFVHGWGQSRIDMLTRLAPWDSLCGRVVLYDLRGHGEATGGPSRLGHDEEHDLLELIRRLGEGPVVLVGHSMGAVAALHAAAAESDVRDRIVGIVAFGPYVDFHESLRGRLRRARYPTRPITDLALLWLRLVGIRHRRVIDDTTRLGCPLLVVHGHEDPISPFTHAERLVDAAADGALHAVPGGGHLDLHEVDGAGLRQAAFEFVKRITDAGTEGAADAG
ncbi:MAG: alpha/beta fold hydrolase [Planctomycetota bacterium]